MQIQLPQSKSRYLEEKNREGKQALHKLKLELKEFADNLDKKRKEEYPTPEELLLKISSDLQNKISHYTDPLPHELPRFNYEKSVSDEGYGNVMGQRLWDMGDKIHVPKDVDEMLDEEWGADSDLRREKRTRGDGIPDNKWPAIMSKHPNWGLEELMSNKQLLEDLRDLTSDNIYRKDRKRDEYINIIHDELYKRGAVTEYKKGGKTPIHPHFNPKDITFNSLEHKGEYEKSKKIRNKIESRWHPKFLDYNEAPFSLSKKVNERIGRYDIGEDIADKTYDILKAHEKNPELDELLASMGRRTDITDIVKDIYLWQEFANKPKGRKYAKGGMVGTEWMDGVFNAYPYTSSLMSLSKLIDTIQKGKPKAHDSIDSLRTEQEMREIFHESNPFHPRQTEQLRRLMLEEQDPRYIPAVVGGEEEGLG